jgi:PPOX class probable F420-dependent enzyme
MSVKVQEVITPGNERAFTIGKESQAASLAALDPIYRQLLETGVTAALATTSQDGRPQLTPVWLNHDGVYINLNSVRGRLKDRNLRARPEITLMVVNPKNPYHWMTIWGTVDTIIEEDDPQQGHLATESIDALAQTYLNVSPYPLRDPKGEVRVLYKVRPTRIQTFGQP